MSRRRSSHETISVPISSEMRKKYNEFNRKRRGKDDDRITWAEAMRRGFYTLLAERQDTLLSDIAYGSADYVPIKVRARISSLATKVHELNNEVLHLRAQSGLLKQKVNE